MTLAGIRRYAGARGWKAEAFSSEASRVEAIPGLLASRMPVAGCIYECADDNIPLSSAIFGKIPVVYLHAQKTPRGKGVVYLKMDNDGVAASAFRELSAGRPSAYATVGHSGTFRWSTAREKALAALAAKSGARCIPFPRRRAETPAARAERLRAWIAALPRRAAVFAVNDVVAEEVVAAARAVRRLIPRELTLLGVDNDTAICETLKPTIPSIQIDFERAGFLAAKMLGEGMSRFATVEPLLAVRRKSTRGSGRRASFVLEAVEKIRREACEGLTAASLAKGFDCSRNLFDLRFREAVGHSPLDEILHIRLGFDDFGRPRGESPWRSASRKTTVEKTGDDLFEGKPSDTVADIFFELNAETAFEILSREADKWNLPNRPRLVRPVFGVETHSYELGSVRRIALCNHLRESVEVEIELDGIDLITMKPVSRRLTLQSMQPLFIELNSGKVPR